MTDYDDLLVLVQRAGAVGLYTVELELQGGRRVGADGPVALPDTLQPADNSPPGLAAFGLDLFNRLFAGRLALEFQKAWSAVMARGRSLRLRLALDPDSPEVHAIPWELLYFDDSGGTVAPRPIAVDPRIAFSRYIKSPAFDEGRPIAERPIRMLMVVSAPVDLERWNLAPIDRETEERDFNTRFSAATASGQFRCETLPRATEEDLRDALIRGALPSTLRSGGEHTGLEPPPVRGYDVLLYYGHALHHPQDGTRLVLERVGDRRVQLFPGEALIALLRQLPRSRRPAMVVLVACNSAVSGQINSLAARLIIESGITAVLAMQRLVEIALARSFTFHLSEHLLRNGVIDEAVNVARQRVFRPDQVGWTTPVLYMRNPEGRLFSPNAQLEYAAQVLRDESFTRWSGAEFIEGGVISFAPGQDWTLARRRPEDAPTILSALDALDQTLRLGLRDRRRQRGAEQAETNLVAVIGPPYSGQTTLLRRLAFELAEAVIGDPNRPLGIYITLNGYDQTRGLGRLERYIIEQARNVTPYLGDALASLLGSAPASTPQARYIFLLDNLDALSDRARADLARELAALARRRPDQGFVLTSNIDLYPGAWLPAARVLILQLLTERQVMRYCRQRDQKSAARVFQRMRDNRLLGLANEPSLLALIYERLTAHPEVRVTRNQIVQEYLDQALESLSLTFRIGDAARESLAELAWYARWNHRERLSLAEVFRIFQQVRRERDYGLEELYALLREVRLLSGVEQHSTRFANPMLEAYLAAQALRSHRDLEERIADIVTLCSSPEGLAWWEDVMYALAGLLADPTPLFERLTEAIRAGSGTHALLAARCLEAITREQEARLAPGLRAEVLDACLIRLRNEREPAVERREQLVAALGRLSDPQLIPEMRRILTEKVRQTASGPRYEYTNVRIAAARALRNLAPLWLAGAPQQGPIVAAGYRNEVSLKGPAGSQAPPKSLQELRDEGMLRNILDLWGRETGGREKLRAIILESPSPPERALAIFALADLGDDNENKLLDARFLLRVILGPSDDANTSISDDWADTMWAAADALTLFEPDRVAPLLAVLVRGNADIPDRAAQQLAYLAGRVRAADPDVIDWLLRILITSPNQSVKARAMQSLAWIGAGAPDRVLELPDGRDGPTVKQIIQDIAAWRPVPELCIGAFAVALRPDDGPTGPLYLRRKAVEALAWIGDAATLADLEALAPSWPLELREQWHLAAATIARRLKGTRGLR
ncbi:MAG: CHAT domain-containing protein [Oscillochloridaceae bacterium]|nr:CHAT domain-containing protein [Chloroflexaceae bacterium]MDW8389494.1 CHAT domain-containing protein [Oscillochloridaceae bacterium]